MRKLWTLSLLSAFTLAMPGCYGGGYQDPEIPEDYQDAADPEVNKRTMMGPDAQE